MKYVSLVLLLTIVGCNTEFFEMSTLPKTTTGTTNTQINFLDGDYPAKVNTSSSSVLATGPNPQRLLVKDFNGDGFKDVMTSDAGFNQLSLRLNDQSGSFGALSGYSSSGTINHIDAEDIDGDGDLDVVFSEYFPNQVQVILNNGSGSFTSSQIFARTGNAFHSTVRFADMNGDGDLDLIYNDDQNISIRLNNGSGSFGAASNTVVEDPAGGYGSNFNDFAIGDIDGDNDLDVINVDDTAYKIWVSKNNGSGVLVPEVTTYPGNYPGHAYLKDIDLDGDLDMIYTVHAVANDVDIVIRMNNGSGSFGAAQNFFLADSYMYDFNFIDMNADGKLDIVFPKSGMWELCYVLNTGNPNFGTPTCFQTGSYPYDIDTVDLHNNGKLLFVVAEEGSSRVKTYSANLDDIPVAAPSLSSPHMQVGVRSGDLDKDGDLDIISSGLGSMSVRMNNGDGTFGAEINYAGGSSYFVDLADVDNDGDLDAVSIDGASGDISVRLNNGSGALGAATAYAGSGGYTLDLVDMNKDGFVDILSAEAGGQIVLRLNAGDGTYPAATNFVASMPITVKGVDVNNDGFKDIVHTNAGANTVSVLISDQLGGYAAAVDLATGTMPAGLDYGDVDKDGDVDIVNTNMSDGTLSVHLNNGNGTFAAHTLLTTGAQNFGLDVVDLEGDGDMDIVTSDTGSKMFSLFLNLGSGNFDARRAYLSGDQPYQLHAADLNKDGVMDIMTANLSAKSVSVFVWSRN